MKKNQKKLNILKFPLEYSFVVIALVFGLLMVFSNPPWQTNDEDRHFYNAYSLSLLRIRPVQGPPGSAMGNILPENLQNVTQSFQGIPFANGQKISRDYVKQKKNVSLNSNNEIYVFNPSAAANIIPYIPMSIGIDLGRIINSNPVYLMWAGRIGGLIFFIIITFFAIRIAPIYKTVIFLFALTPMTLYQCSSITYDTLSLSMTILLFSIFLYYIYHQKTLSTRNIIFIVLFAYLLDNAKDGYFLIPFMFFIIPQKNIGSIRISLLLFGVFVLLHYIPVYTWGAYIQSVNIQGNSSPIRDFQYGNSLSQPMETANIIFNNLLFQSKDWMRGMLGRFGYAYAYMPNPALFVHGLVLIIVAFLESYKEFKIAIWQKLIIALIAIGTIIGITTGMYMISATGANFIFGLQGRYFLQLLPLLLLLINNSYFDFRIWHNWKNVIVSVYAIIMLIVTVNFINSYYYLG